MPANRRKTITNSDGQTLYSCTGCPDMLPREAFSPLSPHVQSRTGIASRCKKCSSRIRGKKKPHEVARSNQLREEMARRDARFAARVAALADRAIRDRSWAERLAALARRRPVQTPYGVAYLSAS